MNSFSPILTLMGFSPKISWISLMDVEPKIAVLADEDVEEDPDLWCSYTECGQELWQIACQWVWNEAPLPWPHDAGKRTTRYRVGTAERTPVVSASGEIPETYGSWQWARGGGRGQIGGSAFT